MNTIQLRNAQNEWGFALDIALESGKLIVANDGFITDNPADITAKKHSGYVNGFYYQFKRRQNVNVLHNVIYSLSKIPGVPA